MRCFRLLCIAFWRWFFLARIFKFLILNKNVICDSSEVHGRNAITRFRIRLRSFSPRIFCLSHKTYQNFQAHKKIQFKKVTMHLCPLGRTIGPNSLFQAAFEDRRERNTRHVILIWMPLYFLAWLNIALISSQYKCCSSYLSVLILVKSRISRLLFREF